MFFKKKKNLVGLDIGTSGIKVVELKTRKKGEKEDYEIAGIGFEVVPPQAIIEGAVIDYGVVADAISKAFENAHIKNKDVAISISGSAVFTRRVHIPNVPDDELEETIFFEAKNQLSTSAAEDVFMDYQILSRDEDKIDVVFVAVKKDKVNEFLNVVVQAGKNPVVVDIDQFALTNAVDYNYSLPLGTPIAVVNVGAYLTNIVIMRDGLPILTRDIAFGGNNITDLIQKEFHLDFERAEMVKKGQAVSGISPAVVESTVKILFEDLKNGLRQTFDYYQTVAGDEGISRIYLSGGSVKLKGLPQFIEENFNVPAEIVNPFQNIYYSPKKFDEDYLNEMAPVFGVAVGLGMRKTGE